jgi:hypothetical protein
MIGKRALKRWKASQRAIKDAVGEDIDTTEKLMIRVRATFDSLDTSGDGFIDAGELVVVRSSAHFRACRTYSLAQRVWKKWDAELIRSRRK